METIRTITVAIEIDTNKRTLCATVIAQEGETVEELIERANAKLRKMLDEVG